jgi:hypothetical protein
VLKEAREEICATHASGHMTVSGYLWMTIERDWIEYVKKYHKYQMYSDKINAPSAPLFNLTSLWP